MNIGILGDGGWGTALAIVLARKGVHTLLWSAFPEYSETLRATRENTQYLPGVPLPDTISFTSDRAELITHADILISAVPTKFLRSVFSECKTYSFDNKIIVSVTKGLEHETLLTPSGIIRELLGGVPIVVLSGPTHAEEVARNSPTCAVVASASSKMARIVQELFMEARFRVYTSSDVIGVELAGALKNVIAIAAGLCDGLGFGSNAKSALIARGLQEIMRLGIMKGAQAETFFGLSGLGDLVTTCISPYGRNRAVGERLGKGESISAIEASMAMVAEGVYTTQSVQTLSAREKVEMPIAQEVYRVLYEQKDPLQSISDLMMRSSRAETADAEDYRSQ